jgi:hypothetical protein
VVLYFCDSSMADEYIFFGKTEKCPERAEGAESPVRT